MSSHFNEKFIHKRVAFFTSKLNDCKKIFSADIEVLNEMIIVFQNINNEYDTFSHFLGKSTQQFWLALSYLTIAHVCL